MEKVERLAYLMYDEYCAAVGGKAFNGDDLPVSTEFFNDVNKTKQANAWRAAAKVALDEASLGKESYVEGTTFVAEIETVVNKYSKENGSDTPDFILANYLARCLNNFDMTTKDREKFYGRGEAEYNPDVNKF